MLQAAVRMRGCHTRLHLCVCRTSGQRGLSLRNTANTIGLVLTVVLCGCSDVGFGLGHHPGDCAIGIPWADCLPGTPGYNNGGGQQSRAAEAKQKADALRSQVQGENQQCAGEMQSADLDIIRAKVELFRESADAPVPFAIASNDDFPSEPERAATAKWATIRDGCNRRADAIANSTVAATPLQATVQQQDTAFRDEVTARVGQLIVALYQAKLTYGEFAQKR